MKNGQEAKESMNWRTDCSSD